MDFADRRPHGNLFDLNSLLYKSILLAFSAYCIFLAVMAVAVMRQGIAVETDIQAIVPQNSDPAVQLANDLLTERFGNLVVFAISGPDKSQLRDCEKTISREVSRYGYMQVRNESELVASFQSLIDSYLPFRFAVLSEQDKIMLGNGQTEKIVQSAWRSLLGFQPGNPVSGFVDDPLRTFSNFYNNLPFMQRGSGFDAEGFIRVERDHGAVSYVRPVIIEFDGGALDMSAQQDVVRFFNSMQSLLQEQYPQLETYRSGFVFHAENAAGKARQEFTLISLVSIAGILLVFLVCFASLRPLLLGIASLFFGFAAAAIICGAVFQKLHLITLVFGASLIGVAVDYSVHYFARLQRRTANSDGKLATLKSVFPSLLLGLITTVAGYACLFQSTLPGLREIAAFCITGLISAWLFVVCMYPWLAGSIKSTFPPFVFKAALLPEKVWRWIGIRRSVKLVTALAILSALIWFVFGNAVHDIRLLYKPPAHLMEQDIKVGKLFPEQASNQYFMIVGRSPQELLQNEESLKRALQLLVDEQALEGFSMLSHYIPSITVQKENHRLLSGTLYADDGELKKFVVQAGIEDEYLDNFKQSFRQAANKYLTPEDFLEKMPEEFRYLWLGEHEGSYYSMATLNGIKSLERLPEVAGHVENVVFVDRVRSLSETLKLQYQHSIVLLIIAYLLIGLILLIRYRSVGSLAIVSVPLIASFVLLALLTVLSIPVGLFHILALYLSLGLGLDYGIFIYDSSNSNETSVAVMLSALTSSLSFGMLSLSSTPMISAFGLSILVSGLASLLLAPLLIEFGRQLTNGSNYGQAEI